MMRNNVLITLGLALLMLGGSAASALATSGSDDKASARAFRYELRALGARAGEAVLFIGAEKKVGGRELRKVRIDARTEGMAAKFVQTETASTTWVDRLWLPVRARWDVALNEVERIYKATFDGRHIKGTDERGGKVFKKHDYRLAKRGADIISIFPWIMQQDMTPGTEYAIEVFDGRRVYELSFTVGSATEIHVPLGLRKAIPLKGTVRRGDAYKRDLTLWLSAEADRAPLKLSFKYGLLGSVDALLVGHRKV